MMCVVRAKLFRRGENMSGVAFWFQVVYMKDAPRRGHLTGMYITSWGKGEMGQVKLWPQSFS